MKNRHISKGMEMASRAATKAKEKPLLESQPLTKAQFEEMRRREEAESRAEIKRLQELHRSYWRL